jgi:alanyl-tRNA synthetase
MHTGSLKSGELNVGQSLVLSVDLSRRSPIMSNHTFTHVTNFALRSVLGNLVDQKGSLVDQEKLRFDFSHNKPLTVEELSKVEEICGAKVKENLTIYSKSVAFASAKKINGLRAVFGETYPDPVNVISIGVSVDDLLANPENEKWNNYSIEFCGGTHLKTTSEAKYFVIVSESGIAKGIRRIIAWTGEAALQLQVYAEQFKVKLQESKAKKGEELDKAISALQAEFDTGSFPALVRPAFQKLLDELVALKLAGKKDAEKVAKQRAEELVAKAVANNQTVIVEEMDVEGDRKALNAAVQVFKDKLANHAVFIAAKEGKKLAVMTYVAKPLQAKLSAGNWARDAVAVAGGKGGGKPESGMGAADSNEKIDEVLKKALEVAKL